MTLAELRAATRTMLGDDTPQYLWPDPDIDRRLNNAVREACLRARLLKDDAVNPKSKVCRIAFGPGQVLVPHAPEILVVRSAIIPGCSHKLWALTAESMDRQEPLWETSGETGPPRYMVMDLVQKTLRLYPTPDAAGLLNLRVWRMPNAAEMLEDDADEPVVVLPDPEELCHWAAYECYMVNDSETFNKDAAAAHLQLFESRFGARPSLHEMARWADSPPRVRHAHMF